MKAIRWHARGDIRLDTVPDIGDPRPGQVVVAVAYCGICGTDLHEFTHGPAMIRPGAHPLTGDAPPMTLGHEFSATVARVGAGVDESWVGTTVVIDPSLACGACRWCRSGDYQTCALGGSVGLASPGGLAEYAEVPVAQLVRVPDGVPAKVAALAEPLAVGLHAARRGAVEPGDRVLVTGAGFVGMAAMLGAFSCGAAEVYVSEPDSSRRAHALALGATAVFDPGADDVRREAFLASNRIGPDVVIDATGRPEVLSVGIRSVRRGGRVVIAGLSELPLECDVRDIVLYERSIVGSLGSKREIARVLDLIAEGRFDPSPLISATYSLDEAPALFASLSASPNGHVKVLVSA